jgi:hypothetical protein
MKLSSLSRWLLPLAILLAIPGAAWAADPVAGFNEFVQNCSSCHSVASTAVIDRGRNSPAKISNAIATVPDMKGLAGLPTTTREDIAAYLGDTPSTLAFAQTTVGETSTPQVVTVRASTFEAITNLAFSVSGDFALQGGTCGDSLAPDASCTVGVVFEPTAAGILLGTLFIRHSEMATAVTIALSGTGVAAPAPIITLDTTALEFGNQVVDTSSTPQTVNVSNSGSAELDFTSIAVTGANAPDFTLGGSCAVGTGLPPGSGCTVTVVFMPLAVGARSATLSLASNASNGSASVALSGTGTATAAPAVTLSPSSVAFGSVAVGQSAAPRAVRLTNSGTASLSIQSIQVSGPFTQTNDCPSSLAARASCTLSAVFTPVAVGATQGTLSVASDAPGSPHGVALSGTGVLTSSGELQWSVTGPVDFATTVVGAEAGTQALTLTNAGPGAGDIGAITLGGTNATDFRIDAASTCLAGLEIVAGGNCRLVLGFSPKAVGARTATLAITSSDAGVPASLQLAGTGAAPAAPGLALSATSLSFGAPASGQAPAQELTLTNSGNADLHVSSLASSSARFPIAPSATSACPSVPFTLAAGTDCSVQVTWLGQARDGPEAATLTITGDMHPATASVSLQGVGEGLPSNGGGGGCTLGAGTGAADPLLLGMAAAAAFLAWRRRRGAR